MSDPLYQIRFSALPENAAHALMEAIGNDVALAPLSVAMAMVDGQQHQWAVEAIFAASPDPDQIARCLTDRTGYGAKEPDFQIERLEDQDWIARSQRALNPVRAGRFVVHGRHDRARHRANRFAIEIEAAQAFGTGHHATTLGCLVTLQHAVQAAQPGRILDIGTGTGVLAIAAAKLCPARIMASDIDPLATAIAAANARINGIGDAIRFVDAAGTSNGAIRQHRYDLIIANILARPLIALAPDILSLAQPRAGIILSGLLATQARAVIAHYRARGAVVVSRLVIDGWVTLMLRATNPAPPGVKTKRPRR